MFQLFFINFNVFSRLLCFILFIILYIIIIYILLFLTILRHFKIFREIFGLKIEEKKIKKKEKNRKK